MIARIWHGVTPAEKSDEYLKYLNETGIPEYRATEGNLDAHILRRIEGDKAHFLTLTFWESIDSIKKFAGEDYEKAKYYPRDKDFLLEFEPGVLHYDAY